ncbi:MAG: hypothetical protein ACE5D3_08695 [Candidatus Binatia bacterium]
MMYSRRSFCKVVSGAGRRLDMPIRLASLCFSVVRGIRLVPGTRGLWGG